jgi:flagellar hook assembly protein FlgD
MRALIGTTVLIFVAMFSVLAQTPATPDFSGTWVLNVAKSTLSKDSTVKSSTLAIENKKGSVAMRFKTDGKKSTETYTPDGQKHVSATVGKSQLMSVANWRDGKLVIESTLDLGIPNIVVTGLKPIVDTWALSADGRTLTHDADDHKETYVYEKQ